MTSKETVMRALVDALKAFFDGGNATNQIAADKIRRFKINMIKDKPTETPSISVVDDGESVPEVDDGTHIQYLLLVRLHIVVKTTNPDDTLEGINNTISDIQKFCDTNQVGGDCSDIKFWSAEQIAASLAGVMDFISDAVVVLHLRYLRTKGSV